MASSPSKISNCITALVISLALTACASQAPRITNAALGFTVTNISIEAGAKEQALSDALKSAIESSRNPSAMSAKANVEVDFVRYNSPIIGLFYGGQHHASLSVKLTDSAGSPIAAFPVYVATNSDRDSADQQLAKAASIVISAQAANAFMPIKAQPKAVAKPVQAVETQIADQPIIVEAPSPTLDNGAPCVIGADGNCVEL